MDRVEPEPGPLESCGPDIADLVCEDIQARKQIGIKTYGMPLRPNNGRKALRDLYAELLDACHYTCQELLERDALADTLDAMAAELEKDAATAGYEEELALLGRAWGLRRASCVVRGNHPGGEDE